MSWKKYFTPVNSNGTYSPLGGPEGSSGKVANYSSYLPDVYTGSPNRIERYLQYDTMDMDSEVNAALDIIAEFSTLKILQGSAFLILKEYFKSYLERIFLAPADTFDNVKGQFPIGFKIWDTNNKEIFKNVIADIYDKNAG